MRILAKLLGKMSRLRSTILDIMLHAHNTSYAPVSHLALLAGKGTHLKHRTLDYHQLSTDNLSPDSTVLDIRCGTEDLSRALVAKARRGIAIDILHANIETAREHTDKPSIEHLRTHATTLNMKHYQTAHVALSNVLAHINDRASFSRPPEPLLLSEAPTPLRVPMVDRDGITLFKHEHSVEWRLDPTHVTEYPEKELRAELADAGLTLASRFGELYGIVAPIHRTCGGHS